MLLSKLQERRHVMQLCPFATREPGRHAATALYIRISTQFKLVNLIFNFQRGKSTDILDAKNSYSPYISPILSQYPAKQFQCES